MNALYEKDGAQVVFDKVLVIQVCVPETWTDEQIVEFAVEYERTTVSPMTGEPCGRPNPMFGILEDAGRVLCQDRKGYIHLLLHP